MSAHRCWAEIDLAAFERNLKRIQAALPAGVRYISVVKADAYGHGMPQIVRRLMQSGVDCFAVANVHEAADIRNLGAGWPILVLSPILPGEEPRLIDCELTATVSSAEEVERLSAVAFARGTRIDVHLKIDTGMGRLGVWHEWAGELFEKIRTAPALRLQGIYTHFSSADSDPEFTALQRRRFLDVLKRLELPDDLVIHADNSASLESLSGDSPFNAVRVGLLQFGVPPYPDSALARARVEPVFSFHTRVGIVKQLPAGCDISYGRTRRLPRDSTVAVLTAGYGDGIPLPLSNTGQVLIRGRACPILGRVTMDQTIVDVTDLPQVAVGDEAVLIGRSGGREISVAEFSNTAGSIPWETLCSITKRVTRVYTGGREI